MSKRRSNTKARADNFNQFLNKNPIVEIPTEYNRTQKVFSVHDMKSIQPKTRNQARFFQEWQNGYNIFASGVYGTGKSFIGMYLALNAILDPNTPQKKLVIIKNTVQSRELGFLKGSVEDKVMPFTIPYINICDDLFDKKNQYKFMEEAKILEFHPSSFVRGNTFNDAVVIIDEIQNFNYTEAMSCLSRVGINTRVIVLGDGKYQNDLQYKKTDQSGFNDIYKISSMMPSFRHINFEVDDIVRSGFCKELALAMIRHENM
jgi:phosphate starvation-inducible protein PhoH